MAGLGVFVGSVEVRSSNFGQAIMLLSLFV